MAGASSYLDRYRDNGFAVVAGVFDTHAIGELRQAFDEIKAAGEQHPATFRHGNLLYVVSRDAHLGSILRLVQWPSYIHPVLARYRVDARMLALVEPLVGRTLKQTTNSMIWKTPDGAESSFAYHQDCRFRRPATAYRNLATSLVQTAIAVDAHCPENGCMRMYPGSHRRGELPLGVRESIYEAACDDAALLRIGLDPAALVDVCLDPGDVVMWNAYTVHGSHRNRSDGDRRLYINAYVVASDCDRGEWAFRDGVACALGAPALIQYEDLYVRPEPHYVDGPPHPFKLE